MQNTRTRARTQLLLLQQELEAAASSAAGADPLSGWALERFWRPAAGGGAAPLRAPPPLAGVSATAAGTSRYLTDFQVCAALGRYISLALQQSALPVAVLYGLHCGWLPSCSTQSRRPPYPLAKRHMCVFLRESCRFLRLLAQGGTACCSLAMFNGHDLVVQVQEVRVLGRGAFGVVVAAVNRLDGRQYAVKRIRLDAASPAAFARLLREVATLSRLQHPHVVRYFQVHPRSHLSRGIRSCCGPSLRRRKSSGLGTVYKRVAERLCSRVFCHASGIMAG